ncbi:hypothetical protein [Pseudoalteromonas spongiae]|uniref:hypothetical protein n=1 Tax=Pseudoalteromonas spongiae TaxID=298657 RepID=UPI000C2D606F|nr:hypothetical protein [Pseudoalteromonas spongiae]
MTDCIKINKNLDNMCLFIDEDKPSTQSGRIIGLYKNNDIVLDVEPVAAANISKRRDGSWMVENIWGPGWSPTLYKILIQLTSKKDKGISPFQEKGKVSKKAIGVWEAFYTADELIKTTPTSTSIHSEPCLNQIYSCTADYYDLDKPISNHQSCITEIPKKTIYFC